MVVVLITQRYRDKVNGGNGGDNCHLEFTHAALTKTKKFMVPVVMEPEMRQPERWLGKFGMNLASQLYVDWCEDDKLEDVAREIIKRVHAMQLLM